MSTQPLEDLSTFKLVKVTKEKPILTSIQILACLSSLKDYFYSLQFYKKHITYKIISKIDPEWRSTFEGISKKPRTIAMIIKDYRKLLSEFSKNKDRYTEEEISEIIKKSNEVHEYLRRLISQIWKSNITNESTEYITEIIFRDGSRFSYSTPIPVFKKK